VTIGSSLALLQLAARSKARKFNFGGSINVYGVKSFAEYGEVSEEQPTAPNTVYGVSKRYIELGGQDYCEQGTFQFVAVRIAMAVGPGAVNTSTLGILRYLSACGRCSQLALTYLLPPRRGSRSFKLRMSPKSSSGSFTSSTQSTLSTIHLQKIGERVIWLSTFTPSTRTLR